MSEYVDLYTDGSWRQERAVGGAGWISKTSGVIFTEGNKRFELTKKDYHPHGSDIAEIAAVAYGLEEIPAQSKIRLYMDCANVIDWLNGREVKAASKRIPPLLVHFDKAVHMINKMAEVRIIQVSGNNMNHGKAHTLARTASRNMS